MIINWVSILLIVAAGLAGCGTTALNSQQRFAKGERYQSDASQALGKSKAEYQALLTDPEYNVQARIKLAQISLQEGDYQRSIELLAGLQTPPPDALRILALANFRLNQFPQAIQTLEQWDKIQPNNPEVLYYLGLTNEKQNLFPEAIDRYENVVRLAAASEFGQKAIAALKEIEARGQQLTLASLPDGEVKNLIQKAPKPEDYPNAGAAILLDEINTVIHPDNTETTTVHRLIKILDDRGKGYGEVEIGFDSTYQSVRLDLARTIKADGTIVPVGKKAWREVNPWSGFPLYSNVKSLVVSMPEVLVGAVIEYQATIEASHLLDGNNFQVEKSLQSHEPKIKQRIIFTAPKERTWKAHYVRTAELTPKITEQAGNVTYQWEVDNAVQIIPEPMMPPWADIMPSMFISSFNDWKQISDWISDLAKGQLTADDAIRQKVTELTAGKTTPKDKAKAIFHWVAPEIRYVGLEYGVSGYKPHNVAEIFKNKYGDCKDEASLLVTMLREAGIKAYPVLINTVDNGQILQDIPMLQFDHCIAVAEIDGELIWLDPTYKTCQFGYLPPNDQNCDVLVLFDTDARFIRTPYLKAEESQRLEQTTFDIQENGGVKGQTKVDTTGSFNMDYRSMKFIIPIKRREMFEGSVNAMFPGGTLQELTFSDLENRDVPVSVDMVFIAPNYLKKAGNLRVFQIPGLGVSAAMVGKEERKYPIFFGGTAWTESQTKVNIPANFKVKHLPATLELELPEVTYLSKYELDGNNIKHNEKQIVRGRQISIDRYKEYKQFVEKIAKAAEESIILEEQ